jgi:hypothetical protein
MGMGENKEVLIERYQMLFGCLSSVLAARDAFTFFCSLLHAKFQHKGFALWEGSHTPRPASPSHRKANR